MAGDTTALRLCLERLIPVIKIRDDPVHIDGLKGSTSLVEQGRALIDALSSGQITPLEAATMMQSIAGQSKIIEIEEFDKRLSILEGRNTGERHGS